MTFEMRFGVSYLIIKIIQYFDMINFDLYMTLAIALGFALLYSGISRLWNTYHVRETEVETEYNPQVIKKLDYEDGMIREVVISENVYTINKE
jgi:hypothetical protein